MLSYFLEHFGSVEYIETVFEIYFQDPQFGYYFLVLTSQRLLQNIDRLQKQVAAAQAATTNKIA